MTFAAWFVRQGFILQGYKLLFVYSKISQKRVSSSSLKINDDLIQSGGKKGWYLSKQTLVNYIELPWSNQSYL